MIRPWKKEYDLVLVNTPSKDYSKFKENDEVFIPPIGLGSIATYVEEFGFTIGVLDADALILSVNKIIRYLRNIKAKFIGLNATSENIHIAGRIAEGILFKKVIIGGIHASLTPKDVIKKYPSLYAVVHGEGEEPIRDILEGKNIRNILGVVFKKETEIIVNPKAEFINLRSLPIIDRKFFELREKEFHLISARGCPNNCSFCASPILCQRIVRFTPMEIVIKEMVNAYGKGTKSFYFLDDQLLFSLKRAYEFIDSLRKSGLYGKIEWRGMSRADTILRFDDILLEKLKESGGKRLSLGIESGSDRILKMVHKGINKEIVIKGVDKLRKAGFEIKGFFIIGFPTETYNDMLATKDLIIELGKRGMKYFSLATFRPYPGTELYNCLIKQGYKPSEIFYEDNIKEEKGLKNEYLHGYYNKINKRIRISQVSNEKINGLKKEIIDEFNLIN